MSFNVSYLVGLLISCIFDRSTCSKRSKESLRRNLSFCRLDSILLSLVFLTFFVSGKKHLLRFSDLYVKSSILYTYFSYCIFPLGNGDIFHRPLWWEIHQNRFDLVKDWMDGLSTLKPAFFAKEAWIWTYQTEKYVSM